MEIAIHIPEDVAQQLQKRWGDLSRRTLEAVAVDAYRDGLLTSAEVGRLLGHSSRFETEALLKQAGAYLEYNEADLQSDLESIRSINPL